MMIAAELLNTAVLNTSLGWMGAVFKSPILTVVSDVGWFLYQVQGPKPSHGRIQDAN